MAAKLSPGALKFLRNNPQKFGGARNSLQLEKFRAHQMSQHIGQRQPLQGHPLQGGHPPVAQGGIPTLHNNPILGHGGVPQGNPFAPGGGHGGQPQGGYTGLQGIIDYINKNGLTGDQLTNLTNGATGSDGMAVGGANGVFAGLSPYAAHWLATSGLLTQNAQQSVPTTDAQGNPLTGTALAIANAQNALYGQQAPKYSLAQGITSDQLGSLIGMIQQGGYAKGYGAGGATAPALPGFGPAAPPYQANPIVAH